MQKVQTQHLTVLIRALTVLLLILLISPTNVDADHSNLKMPFQPGPTWRIMSGYHNTSSHEGYELYSLDLARDDNQTTEQSVVAGASGTVAWIDADYGCVSIDLQDNYYLMTCHVLGVSAFSHGQSITQGQVLGTVGPAGQVGNNGTPHIHLTLYSALNWRAPSNERTPIPFENAHGSKLDGHDFPPNGQISQWARTTGLQSTNGGTNSGGTVQVTSVSTTDNDANPKTVFNTGDILGLRFYLSNTTAGPASITFSWDVYDPDGNKVSQLSYDNWQTTINAGNTSGGIGPRIPSTAIGGVYTFQGTALYNHTPSSSIVHFTVSAASSNTSPGRLQVVGALSLSTGSPQVGQQVSGEFRVKNVGGQAMTLRRLLAGGRGPDCTDNWGCARYADFPPDEWITLQPNQEYAYSRLQTFGVSGCGYFAEPVYQDTNGNWNGISQANRITYCVQQQQIGEIIVDERDGGFTKGGTYWWDDWSRGYNGHMYYTKVNGNVVSGWGEWRPNLPSTRAYEVYVYISDRHTNTTGSHYEIHHRDGVTIVALAQRPHSNQWVSLGTFTFNSGTSGYIRLTDATGEPPSKSVEIGFDAIKWSPILIAR